MRPADFCRERFLCEMEQAVPWGRLVALIEPFYPTGARGRPPLGLERMRRVYFLQQWYALGDAALEDTLYDSRAMRAFVGGDVVPDATTLLKFRHLLARPDLPRQLFAGINALLAERGRFLREGTIVDATILAAPPSTKNAAARPRCCAARSAPAMPGIALSPRPAPLLNQRTYFSTMKLPGTILGRIRPWPGDRAAAGSNSAVGR